MKKMIDPSGKPLPTLDEGWDTFQANLNVPFEAEEAVRLSWFAGAKAVFDLIQYAGALDEPMGFEVYKSIARTLQMEVGS